MAKIVCVDFDGVIHSYTSGWKGVDRIPDPPVPGAFEWLHSLLEAGFEICVYSSRSKDPKGVEAMKAWFGEHLPPHDLERLSFPTQKPAATMTVDDRCFCFQGDFPSPEWIERFEPWYRRVDVKSAREVIARAFHLDPDFRETYVANVAMLLHDRHGITEREARNQAASDVLDLIFGDPK